MSVNKIEKKNSNNPLDTGLEKYVTNPRSIF